MELALQNMEWARATERAECNGEVYFCNNVEFESVREGLPDGFFAHELLGCDASNTDSVAGFVFEWGFPFVFCDFRNDHEAWKARRDTKAAAKHRGSEILRLREKSEMDDWAFCSEPLAISLSEAALGIRRMQTWVELLFRCLDGEELSRDENMALLNLNRAARPNTFLQFRCPEKGSYTYEEGELIDLGGQYAAYTLTNAVANQILETFKDPRPWKKCGWCGHWFKTKRAVTDYGRKNSTSVYCCERCNGNMKDYRKGKRTTPPAWWNEGRVREVLHGNEKLIPKALKALEASQSRR